MEGLYCTLDMSSLVYCVLLKKWYRSRSNFRSTLRLVLWRRVFLLFQWFSVCYCTAKFRFQTKVPIETLDNLLRLQPMFVQALWPKNSPLLQLPHITDHNLPYLRKANRLHRLFFCSFHACIELKWYWACGFQGRVFSCGDLAAMDGEKRRNVLKSLSDEEYRNVLVVLSSMPRLSIQTAVVGRSTFLPIFVSLHSFTF